MNITAADIVISKNGRDAGKRFIVIETGEEYSLLADGKGRRFEKPKKKKNKHLIPDGRAEVIISEKLAAGEVIKNSDIRKALAQYTEQKGGVPKCQKTT